MPLDTPKIRGGIDRAGAGRRPCFWQRECDGIATDYSQRADRVRERSSTRLVQGSFRAWHGPAATLPALARLNTV